MATSGTFLLRMEPDAMDKIRYIAKQNMRSINKEMEFALKQYIEAYEASHGAIEENE